MKADNTISLLSSIRACSNRYVVKELVSRGHHGLAPSHGNILAALIFTGDKTKKEISEMIGKDRSTVTVLLRKLDQLGYIHSKVDERDRRSSIVSLTQMGIEMKKDFIEISEKVYEIQYKGMTEDQVKNFKECLRIMNHNFKKEDMKK